MISRITFITKLAHLQRARPLFSGYSTLLQQQPKNTTTNDPTSSRVPRPEIGQNVPRKDKISFLVSSLAKIEDDNKELIYSTLDSWVAWEQSFPIGALKNVLLALEREKQWHRMIQVIKWMLSKGQGTTRGTYGQLIEALDNDHRIEEAHEVWKSKLGFDLHSVPWKLCKLMISVYYRNKMFEELVKLFEGLEGFDRKPPEKSIVQKVADAYELLGMVGEKERVMDKYKDLFDESSRGRKIGRTRFSPKKGNSRDK